ncbi:mariner Mos1 transposase [Trichonephila clavipes]|nr:mariner Mos1 transposase [Trichonephila clavipes]
MRLSRALKDKWPQYNERHDKVILQHDNARPHVAKVVKTYLETLKWEVLPHPLYSPELAPSDYHLFRSMAQCLADQYFRPYEEEELVNTSEEAFSPLTVKELSPNLIQFLSEYSHVFSKNKYDVGCKVNSSPTQIPWTKFQEQLINEYNLTPHSVTKFPPAYLLFGTLPYTPPLAQNQVYPPVEEARKLPKENTIKYHEKNKIKYDACFIDSSFEPGDIVIYEEFNYPNRSKLSPIFSGPYEIVQKLSDVNYEITKPNALTKTSTEIVHVSKLRTYYLPEGLKLSHE